MSALGEFESERLILSVPGRRPGLLLKFALVMLPGTIPTVSSEPMFDLVYRAPSRDRYMEIARKHSGLGVASLTIFLGGFFLAALIITLGLIIGSNRQRGFFLAGSLETDLIIGGAILGALSDLVAFGLGIAGLYQKDRKKVFAILGTTLSGLIVLAALALLLFVMAGGLT